LADGGQSTRWADNYSGVSRPIKIKVTKATLTVTVDDAATLGTSWEKGEVSEINLTAKGVMNNEAVKLNVYYTVDNGSPISVGSDAFTQVGDEIHVKVNIDSFSANKSYQLFVELESGNAINDNYTLATNFEYDFFILTATIREIKANWQVYNLIEGTKSANDIYANMGSSLLYLQNEVYADKLEYNGKEFEFTLDNLPNGILATYVTTGADADGNALTAGDLPTDAGHYTTTVTISADTANGYTLGAGIPTTYTIQYDIDAVKYDLSQLTWLPNPMYVDEITSHTMTFDNAPDWITANMRGTTGYVNSQIDVGPYTAGYTLYADVNHTFENNGSVPTGDSINIPSGKLATMTHMW
ncbi:MAG: hypothetical protein K2N74_04610, partial [Clostridiales bacterium]|nr:hypothetical protein [Clostridiales bacterium]